MTTAAQSLAASRPSLPTRLDETLRAVLAGLQPVAERRVGHGEAEGLHLAQDLVVPQPVPPQPIALRAGRAVSAGETAGATPYSPALLSAEPFAVGLGQPLPPGTDAVLSADALAGHGGLWEAFEEAAPGNWARRTGEDLRPGTVLRSAGQRLSALDAGIGLAAGLESCLVRQPVVGLIYASPSSPALRLVTRLAASSGAGIRTVPRADQFDPGIHILLTTEPLDPVLEGADRRGSEVVARGLALRPCEEGQVGKLGSVRIFSAPDRIADWLALWLVLVQPCLEGLAGASPRQRSARPLTRKVASTIGLAEIVLLRATPDGLEPLATGDLPLSALASADFWMLVPPESEGYPAGHLAFAQEILPR